MNFTPQEYAILGMVQNNLPDGLTPYADIAANVGCAEADVLNLLQKLKDTGVIRRFGASIKHQKTGWTYNAMVAWKIDPLNVDRAGEIAATHQRISHCYYRPSLSPDWPYEFFTMIHGRTKEDYLEVIEDLKKTTPLSEYAVLRSLKELKKTSMSYFQESPV